MKKAFILFFILFFISFSSAQSLGSLTYESQKEARFDADYEIGVFNLGNETLEVKLIVNDFDGRVDFKDQEFLLQPSEISSNPSGSGWFSISGNKYVKPRKVRLNVRAQNSQNFTVDVRARNPDEGGVSGPSLVQVQSHRLSYERTSDSSLYQEEGGDGTEEQELELREIEENQSEEPGKANDDANRSGGLISIPDPSETENQQNNSLDPFTVLLSLGAAGSLYYLWSVI